jgi:hypothetical protein
LTTLFGAARQKTAAAAQEEEEIPPRFQSKYHTFGQRMKLKQ